MRISIIGYGYLGAVHAVCMAKLGHDIVGIDADAWEVGELRAGRAPFFEQACPSPSRRYWRQAD
jgi:UDPglucose 6-dehydrogenase